MSDKFILDGHEPVVCDDLLEWGRWLEGTDRRVASDQIGGVIVSTVFLGLDHSFVGGAPVLFETMVFSGPLDGETNRYCTWEEAEIGHAAMVRRVDSSIGADSEPPS